MAWIPKKEAVELTRAKFPALSLDEKTILNWAEEGRECEVVRNGRRIGFEDGSITAWYKRIEESLVILNREDYLECFKFGVRSYYHDVTRSDFNRTKQRDVGEFLTNQTSGKLGEIAVKKLLSKHGLEIELDFNVTGQIASQDITRISTRRKVWDNPAVKTSIKATKLKNFMLAVPEGEATLPDRKSELYILSQVGLFPNHILRLIKQYGEELLQGDRDIVPDFQDITARVAGWVGHGTLTSNGPMSKEQQQEEFGWSMNGPNFILRTGALSTDWGKLVHILIQGK